MQADLRPRLRAIIDGDLCFHDADSGYATHNFHAFPAKFPPQLPCAFIDALTRPGDRVLDPMAGSGTTLVEAYLAGRAAVGVDIDPLAVEAARANAQRNGVSATFHDSAQPIAGAYDLVVANILSNPLRVLAPAICAHVRCGGRLALSGILREQADEIMAIYGQWLAMRVADFREDWVCLAGTKS